MRSPLAAALLGLLFAIPTARMGEDDAPRLPELGSQAPTFRLNDHEGNAVEVGPTEGEWTVLAFYPKAMTPGCTKEVCSLRDAFEDLKGLDVRVYGLSTDDVVSQRRFWKEQELNFPLLSDPDGSAAAKYGVAKGRYASRVTFVLDPEGKVRIVDTEVSVGSHGPDLAQRIRALRS